MILDQTWNKKDQKLTLSYIDKQGNRQFFQKYLHHIKSYEYDDNGEFETWNHRRCNKVYKDTYDYTPNMFDLLEFKYELDIVDKLYENNFPKLYFFDIETEYSTEFPYPWSQKNIVPPMIIGHEYVGEIAQLGQGVTAYHVGQKVIFLNITRFAHDFRNCV